MLLPNIIPDQVAPAYATLRRIGFVRGLTLEVARAVVARARLGHGQTGGDMPHYVTQGADADGDCCVSANWDYMPRPVNHFEDDE